MLAICSFLRAMKELYNPEVTTAKGPFLVGTIVYLEVEFYGNVLLSLFPFKLQGMLVYLGQVLLALWV